MHLFIQITIVVAVVTLDSPVQSCDPKPMIRRHEGTRKCMYKDTRGIKTIGIGFNLQNQGAQQALASVGADFNKIFNGASTPVDQTCDCSKVVCLNDTQIEGLFNYSVKQALMDASSLMSNFPSLCCPVQNAVVDMAYNLGGTKLATFTVFLGYFRVNNWQGAADDLMLTKYCQDYDTASRCLELSGHIRLGCPCFGSYPSQCQISSACCGLNTKCCSYTMPFLGYVKKNLTESWCCPLADGACCAPDQHCCPKDFPVCCGAPDQHCCKLDFPICCPDNRCCPTNYPVCGSGGYCKARDGSGQVLGLLRAPSKVGLQKQTEKKKFNFIETNEVK
ncbi:uncharacterized protein LOC106152131 [Lingula anatina]|uniref:Uncharacterized protein LOC106152131 n=1 Tax=Lingula anatina TaxID=7574 RepID=A0A1S3H545_LINAN|nr:uncharacterized protein LOC106152131 [Lingula anatina]XP_013381087.1 uncharacterized protein LOC106152131 [Lingula anatina]|eukprot:XP_013381080.1 uncharacterized protein LOC106152131 [Lingula anatina]